MSTLLLSVPQEEIEELNAGFESHRPKSTVEIVQHVPRPSGVVTSEDHTQRSTDFERRNARTERECRATEDLNRRRSAQLVQTNKDLIKAKRDLEDMERRKRDQRDQQRHRRSRSQSRHRTRERNRSRSHYRSIERKRSRSRCRTKERKRSRSRHSAKEKNKSYSRYSTERTEKESKSSKEDSIASPKSKEKASIKTKVSPMKVDEPEEELLEAHAFELNEELRIFNHHLKDDKWRFPMGRSGIVVKLTRSKENKPTYSLRDTSIKGIHANYPENFLCTQKVYFEWLTNKKDEGGGTKSFD